MHRTLLSFMLFAAFFLVPVAAQQLSERPAEIPVPKEMLEPNSDAVYQQLCSARLSGETATVSNLSLKRDAATFTFQLGKFYFLAPVNGKVTGAVFVGEGSMVLVPPTVNEKRSIELLTKQDRLEDTFSQLVLRFADGTYGEIKKAAIISNGDAGAAAGALDEVNSALRNRLHFNLHARILQDVLGDHPGTLFVAFPKSRKYGRLVYAIDSFPGGLSLTMEPEEVILMGYDETKFGVWCSFHFSDEYGPNPRHVAHRGNVVTIREQNLDTNIEKSGKLQGVAITTFTSQWDGLRVLPLHLFHTLRVQGVSDADGKALNFIQEDKEKDPQFAIILPRALASGEKYTIRTVYGGSDAVRNEGGGNYYPVSRHNWYPNTSFEDYATYNMRFTIPKGLTMVATGARVSDVTEGDRNVSVWKSEMPQTVAGFQFGRFKKQDKKLDGMDFEVEAYANQELPNQLRDLQTQIEMAEQKGYRLPVTLGSINTTSMLQKAMAEAELAVRLYSDYFGPLPYKRLAVTQQTADNYGQAWPSLVWLPISYFYDTTIRHQLGYDDPHGYFKVVEPHEVAHQWWGHTVTWPTYRDQWMSEGFAEFSASLFIQMIQKNNGEFIKFWNDERELLTKKNQEGWRAIDVGPVTQGYRLSNTKSGFDVTRRLIYPKGAYVLHMLRMMMWDARNGDNNFKAMMKDFVQTYRNHPASTEDFKVMVEKHILPGMDVSGNGRMDWFFDEYVYGTALPRYKLDYSFGQSGNDTTLELHITQSGVDDNFNMLVPLYLEMANGKIFRLGAANISGNRTIDQKVTLTGVKDRPKRAMLNYFNDVLCEP